MTVKTPHILLAYLNQATVGQNERAILSLALSLYIRSSLVILALKQQIWTLQVALNLWCKTKFGCERFSDAENMSDAAIIWEYEENMNSLCDPALEDSNPNYLDDNLPHNDPLSCQILWEKIQ